MQVNLLSQDNWKHRHSNYTKPWGRASPYPEFGPSTDTPSPGDRRPGPPDHPASNSPALNPTPQDTLALQTQPGNRHPGVQESEAQEEIAPGDIKYRLEPLPKAPLQSQRPSYFNKHRRPRWLSFGTTYEECYKPGRIQPVTYHGEKPSHSGDTTHQVSLQSPLLGRSLFPIHVQGRKIGPTVRPGYVEYMGQYQSDFQASEWNQVLKTDPDKRSQGIHKYIQAVQKLTAPGWQPTTHRRPKAKQLKQERPILGRKSTVNFDGDTLARMSYLPPPNSPGKTVKGKCPSSTLRVFEAKLQTETTSKQFLQDRRTQPQIGLQDPHHRGSEKPLKSVASQAPTQDQTTTRISYMPLFSERLNLCKPKVNSTKREPNTISLLSKGKHSGLEAWGSKIKTPAD